MPQSGATRSVGPATTAADKFMSGMARNLMYLELDYAEIVDSNHADIALVERFHDWASNVGVKHTAEYKEIRRAQDVHAAVDVMRFVFRSVLHSAQFLCLASKRYVNGVVRTQRAVRMFLYKLRTTVTELTKRWMRAEARVRRRITNDICRYELMNPCGQVLATIQFLRQLHIDSWVPRNEKVRVVTMIWHHRKAEFFCKLQTFHLERHAEERRRAMKRLEHQLLQCKAAGKLYLQSKLEQRLAELKARGQKGTTKGEVYARPWNPERLLFSVNSVSNDELAYFHLVSQCNEPEKRQRYFQSVIMMRRIDIPSPIPVPCSYYHALLSEYSNVKLTYLERLRQLSTGFTDEHKLAALRLAAKTNPKVQQQLRLAETVYDSWTLKVPRFKRQQLLGSSAGEWKGRGDMDSHGQPVSVYRELGFNSSDKVHPARPSTGFDRFGRQHPAQENAAGAAAKRTADGIPMEGSSCTQPDLLGSEDDACDVQRMPEKDVGQPDVGRHLRVFLGAQARRARMANERFLEKQASLTKQPSPTGSPPNPREILLAASAMSQRTPSRTQHRAHSHSRPGTASDPEIGLPPQLPYSPDGSPVRQRAASLQLRPDVYDGTLALQDGGSPAAAEFPMEEDDDDDVIMGIFVEMAKQCVLSRKRFQSAANAHKGSNSLLRPATATQQRGLYNAINPALAQRRPPSAQSVRSTVHSSPALGSSRASSRQSVPKTARSGTTTAGCQTSVTYGEEPLPLPVRTPSRRRGSPRPPSSNHHAYTPRRQPRRWGSTS